MLPATQWIPASAGMTAFYFILFSAALLRQAFVHCLKVYCKLQETIVHWSNVCRAAATSICTLSESLLQAAGTNCTLVECLLHCCDRKKRLSKVVAVLRLKKTTSYYSSVCVTVVGLSSFFARP